MAERVIPPIGEERDEALALAAGYTRQQTGMYNWWRSPSPPIGTPPWALTLPAYSTDPDLLPELLRYIRDKGWAFRLELVLPDRYYATVDYSEAEIGETLSAALTAALLRALEAEKGVSDG